MPHFCHKPLRLLCCTALALFINFAGSLNFAQDNPTSSRPASIVILYDKSYAIVGSDSYNKPDTKRTKAFSDALTRFVQQEQQNEYSIISFDNELHLLLDGSTDIKATQHAISKLFSTERGGGTALYDACYLAINKVTQRKYAKKVVIVFSDGLDDMSEKNLRDLQQLLKETKVVVYTVNIGLPARGLDAAYNDGAKVLGKISSMAGGLAFNPQKPPEVSAVFDSLAEKIKNQQPSQ